MRPYWKIEQNKLTNKIMGEEAVCWELGSTGRAPA
jgi:hypothetical protein